MLIFILIILLFLIAAGYFAGIETGLVACNRIKIKILAEQGYKGAILVNEIINKPDEFLSATLIGVNISVVSSSILLTTVLSEFFEFHNAVLISTAVLTPFMLIFCEVFPKSAFLANATRFVVKTVYIIRFFMYVFKPISLIIMGLSRIIMKILRIQRVTENFYLNKNTIQQVFEQSASEGILKSEEKEFVDSILATHKITAREIMVPLVNVISIEINEPVSKVIELMEKENYSRIPIYDKRVDNIVGYITCKDLIYGGQNDTIPDLMRECFYIPETKAIDFLLVEIQKLRVPIVFVVDEYGGCSGIITNEDIAEVIVGEILDEDEIDDDITIKPDGSIIVEGLVDVDLLNDKFGLEIEKQGFETIGGYTTFVLGHFPESGEKFETLNSRFTILEANSKSVNKILIEPRQKPSIDELEI